MSSSQWENSPIAEQLDDCVRAVFEHGEPVPVEKWHGLSTEGKPDLQSIELLDVGFSGQMAPDMYGAQDQCRPNLPWAEDHFQERVSRQPLNPGKEYKNWPHYPGTTKYDQEFRSGGEFTHTYMERMWPKLANRKFADPWRYAEPARGIRFRYGDLDDVVSLLAREPYTRQAWLPIWFPEDTGAVHMGRVPCTLGYHFMFRKGFLDMWYVIRSCDVVRYLRDDVYMAIRLCQWVLDELRKCSHDWDRAQVGYLHFHAFSLHAFEGDRYVRQT